MRKTKTMAVKATPASVSVTKVQRLIIESMIESSKQMTLDEISVALGRPASRLTSILKRLVDNGMVSHRGERYRLLKAGKSAYLASSSAVDFDRIITTMTVVDMDALKPGSITHIAELLKKSQRLPKSALVQLQEALKKHTDFDDLEVASASQAKQENAEISATLPTDSRTLDGILILPEEPHAFFRGFIMITRAEAKFDGRFMSGLVFIPSANKKNKQRHVFYCGASVIPVGEALDKMQSWQEDSSGNIKDKQLILGCGHVTDLSIDTQRNANPTIVLESFELATDPDGYVNQWLNADRTSD